MKKILFGMNNTGFGEISSVFRTSKFDIVESPISFVQMLNDAIDRFEPDMLLISMIRIGFESQNKDDQEKELLEFVYNVRRGENSNLRIGLITQYAKPSDSLFLNAITQLGVWDIYNIPDGNGTLNLQGISRGLSTKMNPDTFIGLIGERGSSENTASLFDNKNELESKNKRIAQLEAENDDMLKEIYSLKEKIANSNNNTPQKKYTNSPHTVNKGQHSPAVKQKPREKSIEKIKKPKRPKHTKKPKNSKGLNKIIIIGILIAAVIFVSWIFWYQYSAKANNKPTLSSYLEKKEYVSAVKNYPKDVKKIEDDLLNDESIEITKKKNTVKIIESINDNPTVKFDSEFFEKNYAKALEIYLKNDEEFGSLSDARRKELGLCYAQVNRYELALDVTEQLNDSELTSYIKNRYTAYQNIQDEESALSHEGLNDLDKMKLNQMIKKNKKILEN